MPEVLLVAASALLAAVLMARSLDAKSLWIDEVLSVAVAELDFGDLWGFVSGEEMNMALYHLLLGGWTVLGDGEAAVRSLSVVFAVLTVPVLYLLGARLFTPRVGAIAALLLALNATFFSYGREARSYSLTLLLVTFASYLLVRAVFDTRARYWVAYAVIASLAVYAHLFAAWVIVAHAVALLVSRRRLRLRDRTLALTALGIGVAMIPAAVHVAGGETGRTTDQDTVLSDVPNLFIWYAGSYRPLAAVYVLAASVAVVLAIRRGVLRTWPYALVLSWLVVPIVLALVISVTIDPLFVPRYLLVALPALLLLVALGLAAMPIRALSVAALLVVSVASLSWVLRCHPGCQTPTYDFRSATRLMLANARPADGMFFDPPYLKTAFVYYARRSPDGHMGTQECTTLWCSGLEDRASLDQTYPRAWLLIDDGDPNNAKYRDIPDRLGRRYERAGETSFPSRLRVVQYSVPR